MILTVEDAHKVEALREVICGWLVCEGLNPNEIGNLEFHEGTFTYVRFITTKDGKKQLDPSHPNKAWTESVTARRTWPLPDAVMRFFTSF